MTRPIIIMPDPFKAVVPYLQGFLSAQSAENVKNTTVGVKKLDNKLPFVQVRRIGSQSKDVVLDSVRLDFLVWHNGSVNDRIVLTNLARGAVLAMNGTYGGVQVYNVTESLGPRDLPDPSDETKTISLFTLSATMRGTAIN